MKIHADFGLFASSHFDATKYIKSPSYGVNRFMLDRVGDEKARATTIVEYQPNSKFPEHTHIGGEEFLVLEGTFKDQFGAFPAGTYVRNPIDSVHAPWVDEDGCTIFVKLLQMADTGEGTTPLHVQIDRSHGEPMGYGAAQKLYHNSVTGEYVQVCFMDSNQSLPSLSTQGEELLVISGSLTHEGEIFDKWGWLRFPPAQIRAPLVAGPDGAQVFVKTGHLTAEALALEKIQITE